MVAGPWTLGHRRLGLAVVPIPSLAPNHQETT